MPGSAMMTRLPIQQVSFENLDFLLVVTSPSAMVTKIRLDGVMDIRR
jgi:hypothetical protein